MLCLSVLLAALLPAQEPVTLTFDRPEAAGISGFRAMWDTPVVCGPDGLTRIVDKGQFGKAPSAYWSPAQRKDGEPGAYVFDAIHRGLLVRFPGAAAAIAAQLGKGYAVSKVELILPFKDTEFWPDGYADPSGMSFMGDRWVKNPPQWHALVWALRKPWVADPELGPTFNAYLNGAGYWAKFGAQDEKADRFPQRFGPAEVSHKNVEGRVDVTAMLTSADFAPTLAARLRQLEYSGFLVRKWETYDTRYKDGWNGYEYGPAIGGRGILIHAPKLAVTFTPAKAEKLDAKALAFDTRAYAAGLRAKGGDGKPTAVLPSPEEITRLAAKYGLARPATMPDWQWQRVQELAAADPKHPAFQYPTAPDAYHKWLDGILSQPYRNFIGHLTPFSAIEALQYGESWPAPVREHMVRYWDAWLMPGRPASELVHPQGIHGDDNQKYLARTGDWRGNTSFYRAGYTREMSTMNFNHVAVTGALLGGRLTGITEAIADGRFGLENLPLRLWSWYDGSTQESIDHYYLTLTMLAQKEFANWGPDVIDRMMGRSMLTKTVDELTGAYHPGLRRFIATSGRTGIGYVLAIQDGTKHIVHTLSHSGALTDLGKATTVGGMPVLGHDGPPAMIAAQALVSPFGDDWTAYMVDEKPLPFYITNSYKQWGGYAATPLQRRAYMGVNYGVASQDVVRNETVPFMAQWRREAKQVTTAGELGTLIGRYGINKTNLLDSLYHGTTQSNANGSVHTYGSYTYAMQHQNKLLVFTSPNKGLKADEYPGTFPAEVKSLQTTLGLMNFQDKPTWEIRVDGQPVTAYPVRVRAGQQIAIRDGVTYLGITPLPSTDLGRAEEVLITNETGPEVLMQGGGKAKPALLIEQYNFKSDAPMPKARQDSDEVALAYGGFAIELGDEKEYGSFDRFLAHLRAAKLDAQWDANAKVLGVTWRTGDDTIECGFKPEYQGGRTDACFPYRRVNGAYAYLPPGVERDSTLTAMSRLGRIEKNGAVLTNEPGRMGYLQTEPNTGTYAGHNPLPDATLWSLEAPGGVKVGADGRLGLARVVVRPRENRLWVDYAAKAEQNSTDMATALVVFGLKGQPGVTRNGFRVTDAVPMTVDGTPAWVIPLTEGMPKAALHQVPARYARAQQVFTMTDRPDTTAHMIQDWLLVGPFDNAKGAGFATAFGPEQDQTKAAYPGLGGKEVAWARAIRPGQPALGKGAVNLRGRFAGVNDDATAYALTKITADRDRTVTLFTGSDDTITAWVNGEQVLAKNVYRGAAPDQDRADIQLKKGENALLLKICQGTGGWEFYARLGDEFGLPVTDGITYGFGP